jgi:AGZA family xanthine/uracil permease-like MFS transporter
MSSFRYRWAAPGDVNAFFGLMLDNVMNLVILAGILVFVYGFPEPLVYTRMFPGTALGVMFGDFVYTWLAFRLAPQRDDVTAMPLDAPGTMGMAFTVLGPAYVAARPMPRRAGVSLALGVACMILIGVFKLGRLPWAAIQRTVPQAGCSARSRASASRSWAASAPATSSRGRSWGCCRWA